MTPTIGDFVKAFSKEIVGTMIVIQNLKDQAEVILPLGPSSSGVK